MPEAGDKASSWRMMATSARLDESHPPSPPQKRGRLEVISRFRFGSEELGERFAGPCPSAPRPAVNSATGPSGRRQMSHYSGCIYGTVRLGATPPSPPPSKNVRRQEELKTKRRREKRPFNFLPSVAADPGLVPLAPRLFSIYDRPGHAIRWHDPLPPFPLNDGPQDGARGQLDLTIDVGRWGSGRD